MSVLNKAFQKGNTLVGYLTLGDPSIESSYKYCEALCESGVDVLEIGLPFSDPIADGPVIQASHQRALKNGEDVSIAAGLRLVSRLKQRFPEVPLVFMGSVNLVMQYGYPRFLTDALSHGLDAVILPDLPIEMADDYVRLSKEAGLALIQLLSPLCTEQRFRQIVEASEGFLYLISSTGITGERESFSSQLPDIVSRIRAIKAIPIAVGFGVNTPEQCRDLWSFADGVIIGSHFIKLLSSLEEEEAVLKLKERVSRFKDAAV